jgi:hypothetical protein
LTNLLERSCRWSLDAEPRPQLLVLPPAAESLDEAHAAIELWERYSGKTLDPGQRLAVEIMMAQAIGGRWAAATTGREMPRQNGKGEEVEVVELWGLVQRGEAILHTVHDAVLLATQTQDRMLAVLEKPDLRRKKLREWRGTGQQMIEMRNGGIIWYRTRTGGGGRGVDYISRLVVDEAQHAKDEHLSAITPTLFAHPNPQMNVLGTAGLEGISAWWWSQRIRALSDDPGDFGYIGHTAERVRLENGVVVQEPVDTADRKLWMASNPAVIAGRGQGMVFLEEQFRRLGPASFAREHLGVWDPPPLQDDQRWIDLARWLELKVEGLEPPDNDTVRLALDAPPDRRTATFSVAGVLDDGLLYVGVREHLPSGGKNMQSLKDRVVAQALYYSEGHKTPVILPPNSPARAWKADLVAAGVSLDEMTPAEYAEACGRITDAVNDGTLRHRGQPDLFVAIDGLAARTSGDVEVWSRRNSSSNIAPFVAATCALVRVPATTAEPMIYVWQGGAKNGT